MKKLVLQVISILQLFSANLMAQQGQALSFNDIENSRIALENNIQLQDSFTIESWIYPTMKGDFSTIIGNKSPGISSTGYFLAINNYGTSNGKIIFETQNSTNVSINSVQWGQWQHIALTWNGSLARMYINGVLQQLNDSLNMNLFTSASPCYIGDLPAYVGNGNYSGDLDELRIWDYARSQQELQENMYCPLSQIPPSLKLYYQFNEGIAGGLNTGISTIPDLSSSNNTGTLVNFSLSGSTTNWISPGGVTHNTQIQNLTSCEGNTIVIGNNQYTSNGTYIDTLIAFNGCDSILTSTLVFNANSITSQNFTICNGDSINIGNSTYFNEGVFIDNFTNALGCDSIVNSTIIVNTPNVNVTQSANTLQVEAGATAYQWYICDSLNTIIQDETSPNFSPTIMGSYAVLVSIGTCTVSSICTTLLLTNIIEKDTLKFSIFPNPVGSQLTIKNSCASGTYQISNIHGIILKVIPLLNDSEIIDLSNLTSGIYFISDGLGRNYRFIKL